MTPDPLGAALDQLADCRDRITGLETRETAHFSELNGQLSQLAGLVTTLSRTLAEDNDGGGYRPRPAPAWWTLPAAERRAPVAELRDWVENVYRPGYGHLATLGTCWAEHDLCLYALDITSQLWCALYLQPKRDTALLSAQAEYQARILPALAAQLATETTSCSHAPAYPGARR